MQLTNSISKSVLTIAIIAIGFLYSCNNQPRVREKQDPLITKALAYFEPLPEMVESEENEITAAKVLLGKTLYYDVRLSKNNTQSCNTCHNLSTFGVDNNATSAGDLGKNGDRNSPTVLNAAFHTAQFWDGRAKDVEQQAGMPILNPVEMNMPSEQFVVDRLRSIAGYKKLFLEAFPGDSEPITYTNLSKAIGAFERTLVTPSKFHKFLDGDDKVLTDAERMGLEKFMDAGCTTCHIGSTVGGTMFQKFPLVGSDYKSLTGSKKDDKGKMEVSGREADKYVFKVPSLLNITETGPYFHDGSVADLSAAIKIMGKLQLNKDINDEEVASIRAFLASLKGELPKDALVVPAMPN
jgi:cytochrome c peroxidase